MRLHYTADGEMPDETVHGDPIQYVWIVGRRAEDSATGEYELLGVHETREGAETHAERADVAGETELRREPLQ